MEEQSNKTKKTQATRKKRSTSVKNTKNNSTIKKSSTAPKSSSSKKASTKTKNISNSSSSIINDNIVIDSSQKKLFLGLKMDAKTLLLIAIVVLSMFILVIGAAFAFFGVTSNLNQTSSQATITTDSIGTVTLINPTGALHVRLSNNNMMQDNIGSSFYATDNNNLEFDSIATPRVVARATVSGGSNSVNYSCSFYFNVQITGTMKDELKAGDGKLILSGAYSGEYDLASIFTSRRITLDNLSGSNREAVMSAVIEFKNTSSIQDYLQGKSLSISLSNSDLVCSIKGS